MKKINLFLLIALLSLNAFTQESKFVVINNSQDNTCKAFEVKTKTIQSHKYEHKEVDNPEYLIIKSQIDSLENLMNNLTNRSDILDSKTKSNLKKAKDFLKKAINESENAEISFLSNEKKYLTSANEYLTQTNLNFEQDIKGRNSIKQAKSNINKIDDLLNLSINKERKIRSDLHTKISRLKREMREGGYLGSSIPKKIQKYVPVEEIEREILWVDTTTNVGDRLEGSFVRFNNTYGINHSPGYYLIEQDYHEFIKNELVPTEDLKAKISNNTKRNQIAMYIGNFDPRYNSENTYIFKNPNENKLYFTTDNFLGNCAIEEELYKALSYLEKSGGKYYSEEEELWVEVNGAKCMLTPIIKNGLAQKDLTVINKMYKSVKQHKVYKDQASDLAVEMGKYMNKYTSGLITSEDIANWKKITIQCSNLLDKMRALPYADTQEYFKQVREEDKEGVKFVDIIDFCDGSKKMLGL